MFQANLICFLFVMLMWCPLHSTRTGKDVFILGSGSIEDDDSYQCGRNLTLSCKFKKNTPIIVWTEENTISPIARCVENVCSINPYHVGQYTISLDKTQCVFNLTVIDLNIEDSGRKLFCTDGVNNDFRKIKVRDYKPRLFEDTSSGLVKGTSGCISPETNVTFKWFMKSVYDTVEKEIIPEIVENQSASCSKDSKCGNNNHIQYSEIINASASEIGQWYLKLEATHGEESRDSCISEKKYKIEKRVADEDNSDGGNSIMLPVVVSLISLTCVIVVCLVKIIWSSLINIQNRKHEEERCECEHTFHTSDVAKFADGDEKTLLGSFQHKSRSEEDLSSVTVIDIIDHEQKDNDVEPVKGILPSPNLMKTVSQKSNSGNYSHGEHKINSVLMGKENRPVASSNHRSSEHDSLDQATFDDTGAEIDIGKPDVGYLVSMFENYKSS